MDEQIDELSVVIFGRTGEGKSTLANMLIQNDISDANKFPISNSVAGKTSKIESCTNGSITVYDTIGLCEPSEGTTPHSKAIKEIRNYFSTTRQSVNYICYVKKGDRFTNEDKETFKEFKRIFKGGEKNFVIIITNSTDEWLRENKRILRKYYGNHQIIAVDFPFNDREIRLRNRKRLVDFLSDLNFNAVKLEVLKMSEVIESKVAKIIHFVPVIGTTYQLIASGIYYVLSKPNLAGIRLNKALKGI